MQEGKNINPALYQMNISSRSYHVYLWNAFLSECPNSVLHFLNFSVVRILTTERWL